MIFDQHRSITAPAIEQTSLVELPFSRPKQTSLSKWFGNIQRKSSKNKPTVEYARFIPKQQSQIRLRRANKKSFIAIAELQPGNPIRRIPDCRTVAIAAAVTTTAISLFARSGRAPRDFASTVIV